MARWVRCRFPGDHRFVLFQWNIHAHHYQAFKRHPSCDCIWLSMIVGIHICIRVYIIYVYIYIYITDCLCIITTSYGYIYFFCLHTHTHTSGTALQWRRTAKHIPGGKWLWTKLMLIASFDWNGLWILIWMYPIYQSIVYWFMYGSINLDIFMYIISILYAR